MLQLFSPPNNPTLLHYGSYTPSLVLLSILVAIFSSWMGLQVVGQAQRTSSRGLRALILGTGGLALGTGVWAMHFIGMLAFDLCTVVEYHHGTTMLSVLPSIGASALALTIISRRHLSRGTLLVGGVLVGAGIGAMHYTGMAAMRMNLALRYDPLMFALSIVVAVALATLAIWIRFGLGRLRTRLSDSMLGLISATVMGGAITGMHYTGMAAARFVGTLPADAAPASSSAFLALTVTLITIAITVFVMAANGLLRYPELFRLQSETETWMRALLTTTIDGVVTVDRDGVIHEFNASAERIFGWTRADIIGGDIRRLITDAQGEPDFLRNYLSTSTSATPGGGKEVTALRKDGGQLPIRTALGHARLGTRDLFVLFITDISERRAIMQALRDSEQQFRSLIGNIPGISFRSKTHPCGAPVFVSDGILRLTGYPASDFVGDGRTRALGDLIVPEDRAGVEAEVARGVAELRPYQVEYRLRHADGRVRSMWEHGAVTADESNPAIRWIDGVILDISERREMEQELRMAKETAEKAAAARSRFVANMSHEIRTPMNAILGFTDVLLDTALDDYQRRHLDIVRKEGRSLLRLLNEILDTAKLEKGAMDLERDDYNLLGLIDELASTFGSNARAKGLGIDIGYDPALPAWLHGDELRMRQILGNLLDNAIKFTTAGRVGLRAGVRQGQLHITVRDTGIGIAPERLDAIFDPFTQADASMTRRFGGTGLGTTISRQLVTLMGGRIWAESTPGVGTAFQISLPLELARNEAPRAGEQGDYPLPPLHVLAADDVTQNLNLLSLLLTKRGHTLDTVSDGAQAVRMSAGRHYDVILMDVQMPVMDGLAATRAIREREQATRALPVPVVAMTASVLAAHREASAAAGMQGFASKPVDWHTLSHEIARVLRLPALASGSAADEPSLQHLFNRGDGLQRWAGDEEIYQQALHGFAADYGDAATKLDRLLASGDQAGLNDALAWSHRVRGSAANVGLEQLAFTLGRIEELCGSLLREGIVQGSGLPAYQRMLHAQLKAALVAIGAAGNAGDTVRDAGPPPAVADGQASAYDPAAVRRNAAALLPSLQRGAFDDAGLAELVASLAAAPAAQTLLLDQLRDALTDFDFPQAQATLHKLLVTTEQ
ncbi:MHYT domain-containing protein [Duganella radicis]|uniref:Sensory/regulatory protein RpfC n=1 Tax=Duganella radicis TaxID=551988 RepID=A0A6L6PB59_9BURK|nr:MHYT domain-containing protein [Duganella radicis]MTV36033.1 PAS domain S-box protein [Duganella radicis]